MSETSRIPLLSRLAREGWFTQMGEPAATKCLALMLQSETRLQRATTRWLTELTGVDLGSVRVFVPERVHGDGARPDLEGLDEHARPVLVVEAKFGAELTEGQLASYLLDQQVQLDGGPGALVVLVPDARLDYATSVLESARALTRAEGTSAVAVSWDAWLDVWDSVTAPDSSDDFELRSDLNQLRGLVRTMGGLLGVPYSPNPSAPWREWEQDLAALVSEFTREVNEVEGHSAGALPIQSRDPAFSPARYVVAVRRPPKDVFLLVGVSGTRADAGKTPVWAKLSQQYAAPVMAGLHAHFRDGEEDVQGNFWIPLELPSTVGRERVQFMAESLRGLMTTLQTLY